MRYRMANSYLSVEACVSESGFRITSFLDREGNREWLYREEQAPVIPGGSFDEQYGGGMEFLFPADEEETFRGKHYPDHGYLWRVPYLVRQTNNRITAEIGDNPYNIGGSYDCILYETSLLLTVELVNQSNEELPFLARLHPAFLLEKGMELDFAQTELSYEGAECKYCTNPNPFGMDKKLSKPDTWGEEELFFHLKQSRGRFGIHHGSRVFSCEYAQAEMPYLTVYSYLSKQGRVLIAEPASGRGTSLLQVSRNRELKTWKPGTKLQYSFRMTYERDAGQVEEAVHAKAVQRKLHRLFSSESNRTVNCSIAF